MDKNNPILNELKDISTVVAALGRQPVYLVPEGYFEHLPLQVMLRIAIEEKAGADPLLHVSKDNIYQAPQGYFDNLAGNILQRIKAEETGNAREELEILSPLLGQLARKVPFTAPEGYFADFSDNIVAGVKAVDFVNEELENLSPTMRDLKDKQVYEVPEGYFDSTATAFLQQAKQQQPAKLFSIGFGSKLVRYAAAAVVTGIIVLTGYLYSGKTRTATPAAADISTALAKIPDQEVENFLNNSTAALADIGTDLADTDTATTSAIAVENEGNADETKDLLADISDEELQQYVDQRTETPITN